MGSKIRWEVGAVESLKVRTRPGEEGRWALALPMPEQHMPGQSVKSPLVLTYRTRGIVVGGVESGGVGRPKQKLDQCSGQIRKCLGT